MVANHETPRPAPIVPLRRYSLYVFADPASAAQLPARDFGTVAPPAARRRPSPNEPNMTLVDLKCDLMVAGGGLAGVCAAIAAARHGAKVVLVQDRSRLGGTPRASQNARRRRKLPQGPSGWREGGIIEELRLADAANNPQRCWELWDLLLYDKVMSEPNITLLLETSLYSATMKAAGSTRSWPAATEANTSTASPPRCSSMPPATLVSALKPAPKCAPAARRGPNSTNRFRPRRPTRKRLAPVSSSPRASTTARCPSLRPSGRAR